MGFGPPTNLTQVARDGCWLRLTCRCGHVAELEPAALGKAIYARYNDWWCELRDLPRYLRCSACGGKRFDQEPVPRPP